MTTEEAIEHLENMKEHAKDMLREPNAGEIWQKDIEACDIAIKAIHFYEREKWEEEE